MNLHAEIVEVLKSKVSTSLDEAQFDYNKTLREQGIDSLDVSMFIFSLEEKFGISIPTDKIGDLLTIEDFNSYVGEEIKKKKNINIQNR